MEIQEITAEEYSALFPSPYHIYGSAAFAQLNADKADSVFYLLFRDSKCRLGLAGGLKENIFSTPFSAPHGGFVFKQEDIKIRHLDEAIQALVSWCRSKQMDAIRFTLPPTIYHESFIAKQSNSLFRSGFNLRFMDLNYSFNLEKLDENYLQGIWRNARKNLNMALSSDLSFCKCESDDEKEAAYEVIKANREARGFPLRMSWTEVKKTTGLISADFFLVHESSGLPIASAVVFHVAQDIVQVIYWGDLPEHNVHKAMNFLSYRIFTYYKGLGRKLVDIGQSTEYSQPNPGLCEFKESIGCDITEKKTFQMDLL